MKEIAIIESKGRTCINAIDLYHELGIRKDFTSWLKIQVKRGGFIKGRDFIKTSPDGLYTPEGVNHLTEKNGRPIAIYLLTVGTAKYISMMSQTEKGRIAREYFIKIENEYSNQSEDSIVLKAMAILQRRSELNVKQIEVLTPKGEFYDSVANSNDLLTMKQAADLVDIGRNDLYKLLRSKRYLVTGGDNHNLPFRRYIIQGLFEEKIHIYRKGFTEKIKTTTMVTAPKGLDYLRKLVHG